MKNIDKILLPIIAAVTLLAVSTELCQAEEQDHVAVQLHGLSWHADRDADYNERNYGLAVRLYTKGVLAKADYITFGQYENSEDDDSRYVGIGWQWKVHEYVTTGVAVGAVTGYDRMDIAPFVVPSITFWGHLHVTGTMVPTPVVEVSVDLIHYEF